MSKFYHTFKKIILFFLTIFLITFTILFCWVALDKHQYTPQKADAAIVLGAAAWGENPSPVLKARIQHAIDLYNKKIVKYIIFTGGTPNDDYKSEAEVAANWAIKHNIPRQAVLIEKNSKNTFENLYEAKKIAQTKQIQSYILVSDSYHLTRAGIFSIILGMPSQTSTSSYSTFAKTKPYDKFKIYLKETYSIFSSISYKAYIYLRTYFQQNN